ncbi:MAG TPA: hypothetical protein VFE13_08825 [Caulobacteraceae bacterium]|jgi:uncharacterized membrane protein YhaH (DUF805 family)|nr:hypothetical protein [Caulobacteraceae bacterium]
MTWVRLFVSPFGVIGQRTFFHGVVVIVFVNLTVTLGAAALRGAVGWPLLATLYPTVCVTTKRLHAFNVSGWRQAPQRVAVAVALASTLVPPAWWAGRTPLQVAIWAAAGVAALADALMYLYLALSPRGPADAIDEIFG